MKLKNNKSIKSEAFASKQILPCLIYWLMNHLNEMFKNNLIKIMLFFIGRVEMQRSVLIRE